MADVNLAASAPAVELRPGSQIVIDAYDAVTGAPVAGVTVANVAITFNQDETTRIPSLLPKPLLVRTSNV